MNTRVIKFRAWDGLRMTCNGIRFNNTTWALEGIDYEHIMQYTGMKDKNGVEIYDDDIIEGDYDYSVGTNTPSYSIKRDIVKFDKTLGYQWEYWDLHTVKIIGNIYENPELLKGDV